MKISSIVGATVAGLVVAAGVAFAGSFSSDRGTDFFAPGTHQFYVWCADGTDFMATQRGSSASDAQMKLYGAAKKAGRTNCWPVWQGRLWH